MVIDFKVGQSFGEPQARDHSRFRATNRLAACDIGEITPAQLWVQFCHSSSQVLAASIFTWRSAFPNLTAIFLQLFARASGVALQEIQNHHSWSSFTRLLRLGGYPER
jgi:hypothetical protein